MMIRLIFIFMIFKLACSKIGNVDEEKEEGSLRITKFTLDDALPKSIKFTLGDVLVKRDNELHGGREFRERPHFGSSSNHVGRSRKSRQHRLHPEFPFPRLDRGRSRGRVGHRPPERLHRFPPRHNGGHRNQGPPNRPRIPERSQQHSRGNRPKPPRKEYVPVFATSANHPGNFFQGGKQHNNFRSNFNHHFENFGPSEFHRENFEPAEHHQDRFARPQNGDFGFPEIDTSIPKDHIFDSSFFEGLKHQHQQHQSFDDDIIHQPSQVHGDISDEYEPSSFQHEEQIGNEYGSESGVPQVGYQNQPSIGYKAQDEINHNGQDQQHVVFPNNHESHDYIEQPYSELTDESLLSFVDIKKLPVKIQDSNYNDPYGVAASQKVETKVNGLNRGNEKDENLDKGIEKDEYKLDVDDDNDDDDYYYYYYMDDYNEFDGYEYPDDNDTFTDLPVESNFNRTELKGNTSIEIESETGTIGVRNSAVVETDLNESNDNFGQKVKRISKRETAKNERRFYYSYYPQPPVALRNNKIEDNGELLVYEETVQRPQQIVQINDQHQDGSNIDNQKKETR